MFSVSSRKGRNAAGICAALAVLASASSGDAAAFEIAPHRALYTLDLISTSNLAAVADVRGEMVFQWADSCDGWTVEQRYRMTFIDAEGNEVRQSSTYATWESKDGQDFTFNMRNTTNGVVDKEVRGDARIAGTGEGGTATFRLPEETTIELPSGTMFPTAHTLRVLTLAESEAAAPFFSAMLFDGTGLDSLRQISAVIGAGHAAPEATDSPLLESRYWPVSMAFYPEDTAAAEPEYEMAVDLLANGVVSDMIIDYGTFAVRARLDRLEAMEGGGC